MRHPNAIVPNLTFEKIIGPSFGGNDDSSIVLTPDGKWLGISIAVDEDVDYEGEDITIEARSAHKKFIWGIPERRVVFQIPPRKDQERGLEDQDEFFILENEQYAIFDINWKPHLYKLGYPDNELPGSLPGPGCMYRAVFSPDGRTYATYDRDEIQAWDVRTNTLFRHVTSPGDSSLVFSPDGMMLCIDGKYLWHIPQDSLASLKGLETLSNTHCYRKPCFSSDGKLLAESLEGYIYVWDTNSFHLLTKLPVKDTFTSVLAYSAMGFFVCGGLDGILSALWIDDWQITPIIVPEHYPEISRCQLVEDEDAVRRIRDVVISNDGRTMITMDSLHFLTYWELPMKE